MAFGDEWRILLSNDLLGDSRLRGKDEFGLAFGGIGRFAGPALLHDAAIGRQNSELNFLLGYNQKAGSGTMGLSKAKPSAFGLEFWRD